MKTYLRLIAIYAALITTSTKTLVAADDSDVIRKQGDAILAELKAIHELLARVAWPSASAIAGDVKASLSIEQTDDILGLTTAPLTIIEFTDYQCPFCRQFHLNAFKEIRTKYVDSGRVRYVTLDFPLEVHSDAQKAAEATHCASDQGEFWAMRDAMGAESSGLGTDDLLRYAQTLNIKNADFLSCLVTGKYSNLVARNQARALAIGVQGTPTFLIGKSTLEGVVGILVEGSLPFEAYEAKIREAEQR